MATAHKVVFVGDSTVGKTSIIHSFLKQDVNPVSTLGATSTPISVQLETETVNLNVWDTAGQDSLRNLVPIYAKNSEAAIIVFDQSNPSSYEHVSGWFDYLTENVGKLIVCLAANKKDLACEVDFNAVFAWAAEHHAEVVRTSAKEGDNVVTLFETVARALERQKAEKKEEAPPPPTVSLEPESQGTELKPVKSGGGGCC
jgi:small GTP-binding protein